MLELGDAQRGGPPRRRRGGGRHGRLAGRRRRRRPRDRRRGRRGRARPSAASSACRDARDGARRPRAAPARRRRRPGQGARAGSASSALVDGAPPTELGPSAAPPMTVELIQGLLLAFALVVILMSPYIRLLHALGLRQADPRGRAGEPLHQGRHADDGRPPDRRAWSSAIYFFLAAAAGRLDLRAARGAGRRSALLGAFDDYLNARTGEGIRARQKLIWLTVVAFVRRLPDPADLRHHGHRGAVRRRRADRPAGLRRCSPPSRSSPRPTA